MLIVFAWLAAVLLIVFKMCVWWLFNRSVGAGLARWFVGVCAGAGLFLQIACILIGTNIIV